MTQEGTDKGACPTKMDQRKRIAIYGGTFDPVHSGHLQIARRLTELFEIDQFLFVPARLAPHKQDREVSAGFHRYAMLTLATQEDARLCISTFELDRPERQYTVDTLMQFHSRFGELVDLFFVMGADSWEEITTWREWPRLMTLANLIVVTRPGHDVTTQSPGGVNPSMVDIRGLAKDDVSSLIAEAKPQVFISDAVMLDVSATQVRQAARDRNGELEKLVPLTVANYIRKYRLYRTTNEA